MQGVICFLGILLNKGSTGLVSQSDKDFSQSPN